MESVQNLVAVQHGDIPVFTSCKPIMFFIQDIHKIMRTSIFVFISEVCCRLRISSSNTGLQDL